MPTLLTTPRSSEYPDGKNRVQFADEQATAAAAVETWQPAQPKPKPAAANKLRVQAGELDAESLRKKNEALALEEQAVQLEHYIQRAEQEVERIGRRIATLEGVDFEKQSRDAEAALENCLENIDTADPTRWGQIIVLQLLRGEKLEAIRARVLKKLRTDLAAAKRNLVSLTESK